MAYLTAIEGALQGNRFELGERTVLGRSFDADVRIDDMAVSRHHCMIFADGQGLVLEDLGSGNGTILNGLAIDAPVRLHDGDIISLPSGEFRCDLEESRTSSVATLELSDQDDSTIVETIALKSTLPFGNVAPGADVPEVLQKALDQLRATSDASNIISGHLNFAELLERLSEALKKTHQQLHTVVETGNAVSGLLDFETLLHRIMDSLFNVFPQAERGFIMLKEEEGDDLKTRLARRRDGETLTSITISKHIIDVAVSRRVAILSANAMDDQRFAAAVSVIDLQIRSMMCAPLLSRGEIIGMIHLDTTNPGRRFTTGDLELFTVVANQTAMALANARMHQRLLEQERLAHDLDMARRVQHSFLPGEPPQVPGMQFCASYKAALEVGGDFYDFIPLPEGRLALVLGDVAGKGMSAAMMMARMMSDVRFLVMAEPRPGRALAKLNDSLVRCGVTESFVTMILAVLDPATRQLMLANAGHWPPLLHRGDAADVLEIEGRSGLPLGVEGGATYEDHPLTLNAGDTLLMFTDGVTEAMNREEELYGCDRLLESLKRSPPGASVAIESVLAGIHAFVGDTPQSDDVAIICCSVR